MVPMTTECKECGSVRYDFDGRCLVCRLWILRVEQMNDARCVVMLF